MAGQVSTTQKEALALFCQEWNALGRYPTLHPAAMVHENLSQKVALAQSEMAPQDKMSLPGNPHDAAEMSQWIKRHELEDDGRDFSIVPLQLVAVDRKGRMGLLDVFANVGKGGYQDPFARFEVYTYLSGRSLRKTWMDPNMFGAYHDKKRGEDNSYRGDMAEERIKLFQKAMQAMIKDKIKDVEERQQKAQAANTAQAELQALIDHLKDECIDTKALADGKRLTINAESHPGSLTYRRDGLSVTLASNADPHEKDAVITLIRRFEN